MRSVTAESKMNSPVPPVLLIHGSSADYWASVIREQCGDVDITTLQQCNNGEASLESVSGLIGWKFPPKIFPQMPNLRWIQFISVAVDEWAENSLIPSDIVVTNTKGLYGDSVADYIIWALLTLTRQFDDVLKNQTKHRWRQISGTTLRGKTIGILGVGGVGRALAKRAAAFDMKTVGVVSEGSRDEKLPFVDKSVPINELHRAIGEFDVLAVCVPLTDATRNLVDSDLIAKMKPGAYIINAARGEIVGSSAVATALKTGQLAGAALDVFSNEPLRRWSSLWNTENLIITPHVAGVTDDYRERVGELICENVDRFSAGETLRNIVDPKKRY